MSLISATTGSVWVNVSVSEVKDVRDDVNLEESDDVLEEEE